MTWLSFFIGTTSAWVFMGVLIFLLDIIRKPREEIMPVALVKFWEEANRTAEERNDLLGEIDATLNDIALETGRRNEKRPQKEKN